MPWSRRNLTGLVLSSALCTAVAAQAAEIPFPELVTVEERVREKIEATYRAVVAAPRDAQAWGRYGMVLDAHRLPLEAALAYEEAARLDPDEPRWPYYLATLRQYTDPQAAAGWYERAIELDPGYGPARVRFAQTLEALGRYEEAAQQYRRAAALDPENPRAHLGLGQFALARNDVEEAIRHLERAYELGPNVQAVVATLARAYRRAGREELARLRAEEARNLPRRAQHRDPLRAQVSDQAVDSESYLTRSRTYADAGRLERARREIEALLELDPGLARAWFAAAGIYDRLGEARFALDAARRALELDPELQGARAVLAGALFKLERFEEAQAEARRVLAEEPDNVHMLLLTSMLAGRRGDFETMVERLDRAYEARTRETTLGPLMAQLLADVAASLAEVGRPDDAAERMRQALTVAEESGAGPRVLGEYRERLHAYAAH